MRPETAQAFLGEVELSVTQRDFLLSKLFQFLYVPLQIQDQLDRPRALPLRRKLEHWLDGLSKRAVLQLYRFDWPGFFHDSMTLDRATLLAGLDEYLPQTKARLRRTPSMGRRGPTPDLRNYKAVARAVKAIGEDWAVGKRLLEFADYLDEREAPAPEAWAKLDPPATSWRSAVESHRKRVVRIVKYRLGQWKEMRRRVKRIQKAAHPRRPPG